jgi:hypothetical protein
MPANIEPGAVIEHVLMPSFRMTVQAVASCEPDPRAGRPGPHSQYKVTDPDGNEDWLCAYDVREA